MLLLASSPLAFSSNSQIGALDKLQRLTLSFNEIRVIPREIGWCSALQELHVYRNALVELPGEICDLANLRRLDAGMNALHRLPPDIGRLEVGVVGFALTARLRLFLWRVFDCD